MKPLDYISLFYFREKLFELLPNIDTRSQSNSLDIYQTIKKQHSMVLSRIHKACAL